MEEEREVPTSVVQVYAAEQYLDLVKSATARAQRNSKNVRVPQHALDARRRTDGGSGTEAASQLRSAGAYLRHHEALRALEEDEQRQRQISAQNRKIREERKFSMLMDKCEEAIHASRNLEDMLSQQERLAREKCERRYKQWSEQVFDPIQQQIADRLTEDSFLELKEVRQQMHEDYIRDCDRPHGVFLQVPGPQPKDISVRYSSKQLKDPIKADLSKNTTEIELAGIHKQFGDEKHRHLIDPTDYLKMTPTRRKQVTGPRSHKRIVPNDYTELCCDPGVSRRELFPCRKRGLYATDNIQVLTDGSRPELCSCCECPHTGAVTEH